MIFRATSRRTAATRRFLSDPIPDELLNRLLDIAHWAPSGYNLQPTHYTVVTDAKLKPALYEACLKQRQILEAPVVVVFSGDRKAAKHHLERVIIRDREAGAIQDDYESLLRKYVGRAFGQGPMGFGWLGKAALWNHYRVIAQGNRIRSFVNSVPVADFTDDRDASGFIGLQVHSVKKGSGPYTVSWKNIRIRELVKGETVE